MASKNAGGPSAGGNSKRANDPSSTPKPSLNKARASDDNDWESSSSYTETQSASHGQVPLSKILTPDPDDSKVYNSSDTHAFYQASQAEAGSKARAHTASLQNKHFPLCISDSDGNSKSSDSGSSCGTPNNLLPGDNQAQMSASAPDLLPVLDKFIVDPNAPQLKSKSSPEGGCCKHTLVKMFSMALSLSPPLSLSLQNNSSLLKMCSFCLILNIKASLLTLSAVHDFFQAVGGRLSHWQQFQGVSSDAPQWQCMCLKPVLFFQPVSVFISCSLHVNSYTCKLSILIYISHFS